MKAEEFWRQLREQHGYETARAARPWYHRCLDACPSLHYHLLAIAVVVKSGLAARRGKFDPTAFALSSFDILQAIEKCGGRVQIAGVEHVLRTEGPAVYVSNHMSTVETFLLPTILLPLTPIAYVLKESLLRYPVFGSVMASIHTIPVTRRNPKDDFKRVMTLGAEMLGKGISVLLFPQATRDARFRPAAFNTLGVKLAARSGVPVVPVAIKTDFLSNGRLLKDFGPVDPSRTVHVRLGPALRVEGHGRAQHQQVIDFIAASLQSWGGTVERDS